MTTWTLRSRFVAAAQHTTLALLAAVVGCEGDLTTPPAPEETAEVRRLSSASISGCSAFSYRRQVNVSSGSQLSSALRYAQPGDCIQLASGTYSSQPMVTRSGTSTDDIILTGPSTAVVSGALRFQNVHYWRLSGFTIRGGFYCIEGNGVRSMTFQNLDISQCGQEGIVLHYRSSRNVVEGNWIHDVGKTSPQYGEAVYIGRGGGTMANADPSDSNTVRNNRLGPGVPAEHIDVKRGTRGNVIEANQSDASGHRYSSPITTTLYMNGGTNTVLRANVIRNLYSQSAAFQSYRSVNGLWTQNQVSGQFFRGFYLNGTGNVVKCDNVVSGAPFGVTCTR
jgi:hypothetical protein